MGALVWLWLTAQKYWKRDRARIPKSAWDDQRLSPALIETKWAVWEEDHNGYFAEGSEQQFAWLVQRVEAGGRGGEASGEARLRDINNLRRSGAKRGEAEPSGAKPPTPTPTPTPTLSLAPSLFPDGVFEETSAGRAKKTKKLKVDDAEVGLRRETWDSYSIAYTDRWGHPPDRNAAVNSLIKSLVEKVGNAAPDLVRFFVSHNDGFYVKAGHPLTLCIRDYVGLKTQMLRGKQITTADIRRLEKTQVQQGNLEDVQKGGL